MKEQFVSFTIENQPTGGILHCPEKPVDTAVLVVVGGPQYRVGSHRQFVQLSRYLAEKNIVSLRFDCRGMGDGAGDKQPFDDMDNDIRAAIDCLMAQRPAIKKIVIWGLCDAASAALIYGYQDTRVSGLVLLNPWLRDDQAMAKTMVKFYYVQRLLSVSFWKKLLGGKVNVTGSLQEARSNVADSLKKAEGTEQGYQQRMLDGAQQFNGPLCLILSGNDLTAREFYQQVQSNKAWGRLVKKRCQVHRLDDADHTFSSARFKQQVEKITADFVASN